MKEYPGLYIHVPFCVQKCRYCDFVSYADKYDMYDKYIDAVLQEADRYKGMWVNTVFIGGGTPTALSSGQLDKLLTGIGRIFRITDNAEFSVESNPGTTDNEKLRILRSHGVNRLSIGVQSFVDSELKMLGRIHDAKAALNAIETAQVFFDNINIDIMTAVPGQTYESLMHTLDTAVKTGVQHLSCYSLILEEGTELETMVSAGKLKLIEEEQDRKMYSDMSSFLKSKGYDRYEISNFSKPGRESKHNLKYWNTCEYIGIGAGAHSYLGKERFYNSSDLNEYINSPGKREESVKLSHKDCIAEYIIMSLRTSKGISFKEFSRRFESDFSQVYAVQIEKFTNGGFMVVTDDRCYLTDKGIDVSNSIMCEFV